MTAIATVVGILPIAIGSGAGGELRAPLGVAVAGGMVFSTVLTIFVVAGRLPGARAGSRGRGADARARAVEPGGRAAPAASWQVAERPSASLLLSHLCGVAPLRLRVRSVAPRI